MSRETAHGRFNRLIWPLRQKILRTATILCSRADEAEDLAQETLLKAFRSIDQLDEGGGSPQSWLMAILRNTRIDRLRAGARSRDEISLEQSELPIPAAEQCPDSSAVWDDPDALLNAFSDQEVIDGLQSLPEDLRWTLLLVDVESLDHATAAGIMDVPVGTVKSRTHRARAMLRTYFERFPPLQRVSRMRSSELRRQEDRP